MDSQFFLFFFEKQCFLGQKQIPSTYALIYFYFYVIGDFALLLSENHVESSFVDD